MNKASVLFFTFAASLTTASTSRAGTCLSADIMAPAGQAITSPFGVNRSGRASASPGYHQGLDIVNKEGAGTKIFSGSSGPVNFRKFTGGGVIADVVSGDTRFMYLHMATTSLGNGESGRVAAGDQVGTMGCKGMDKCAPHLHLYAALKGNVLAAAGNTPRAWLQYSRKGPPMTADQIKAALPNSWYYVNPEPFLPRQIPIVNPYPDMEGGPRKTSLPKTCAPGSDTGPSTMPKGDTPSMADTQSQQKAIAGAAEIASGSPDHAVKMADQPNRSLYLELSRINATELTANTFDYQAQTDAALAQLLAVYAQKRGPR